MRLVNADAIKEYVSYVIKDSDELLTSSVVRKAVLGIIDTMALYGLVTCEDCKHYDKSAPSGTVEPIGYRCDLRRAFTDRNDFCKYGEKRNGDNH